MADWRVELHEEDEGDEDEAARILREKETLGAYLSVFETEAGQKVLADLRECYHDVESFSENPYQTAFKEGQRHVYLALIDTLARAEQEIRSG